MADTFQPILNEAQNQTSPLGRPMVDTRKGDTYRGIAQGVDAIGGLLKARAEKKKEEEDAEAMGTAIDIAKGRQDIALGRNPFEVPPNPEEVMAPESVDPTKDPDISTEAKKIQSWNTSVKQGGMSRTEYNDRVGVMLKQLRNQNPTVAYKAIQYVNAISGTNPYKEEIEAAEQQRKQQEETINAAVKEAPRLITNSDGSLNREATAQLGMQSVATKNRLAELKNNNEITQVEKDTEGARLLQEQFNAEYSSKLDDLVKAASAATLAGDAKSLTDLAPQLNAYTAQEKLAIGRVARETGMSKTATDEFMAGIDLQHNAAAAVFDGPLALIESKKKNFDALQTVLNTNAITMYPELFQLKSVLGESGMGAAVDAALRNANGLKLQSQIQGVLSKVGSGQTSTPSPALVSLGTIQDMYGLAKGDLQLSGLTPDRQKDVVALTGNTLTNLQKKPAPTLSPADQEGWSRLSKVMITATEVGNTKRDYELSSQYFNNIWLQHFEQYTKTADPVAVADLANRAATYSLKAAQALAPGLTVPDKIKPFIDISLNPSTNSLQFKVDEVSFNKYLNDKTKQPGSSQGDKIALRAKLNEYVTGLGNTVNRMNNLLNIVEKVAPKSDEFTGVDPKQVKLGLLINTPVRLSETQKGNADGNTPTPTRGQTNVNNSTPSSTRRFIYDESKDELFPSE